ncbi:MAG TPA: hypothetical protein VME17_16520 [Bryobacteraceae bacterium]|nr:hypothetical protein [Bryobacteraceae bacterium]
MTNLAAALFAGAMLGSVAFAQEPNTGTSDPAKGDAPAAEQNQAPAAKKCNCACCDRKSAKKDPAAKTDNSATPSPAPAAMGCAK